MFIKSPLLLLLSLLQSSLSKPFVNTRRLSLGDHMDWRFGGWTPIHHSHHHPSPSRPRPSHHPPPSSSSPSSSSSDHPQTSASIRIANTAYGNMPYTTYISPSNSYGRARHQPVPPIFVAPRPFKHAQLEAYKVIEEITGPGSYVVHESISPAEQAAPGHISRQVPLLPRGAREGGYRGPGPYGPEGEVSGGGSHKQYVTLPVAVETDEDKVLTPNDIEDIEREVLKVIPEVEEVVGDKGVQKLTELAPQLNHINTHLPYHVPVSFNFGKGGYNFGGGGGGNNYVNTGPPPQKSSRFPGFLRPLLSKFRGPRYGGYGESAHLPNLGMVHFIAHQKSLPYNLPLGGNEAPNHPPNHSPPPIRNNFNYQPAPPPPNSYQYHYKEVSHQNQGNYGSTENNGGGYQVIEVPETGFQEVGPGYGGGGGGGRNPIPATIYDDQENYPPVAPPQEEHHNAVQEVSHQPEVSLKYVEPTGGHTSGHNIDTETLISLLRQQIPSLRNVLTPDNYDHQLQGPAHGPVYVHEPEPRPVYQPPSPPPEPEYKQAHNYEEVREGPGPVYNFGDRINGGHGGGRRKVIMGNMLDDVYDEVRFREVDPGRLTSDGESLYIQATGQKAVRVKKENGTREEEEAEAEEGGDDLNTEETYTYVKLADGRRRNGTVEDGEEGEGDESRDGGEEDEQLYHAYYGPAKHQPPPGYIRLSLKEFQDLFKDAEIHYVQNKKKQKDEEDEDKPITTTDSQ